MLRLVRPDAWRKPRRCARGYGHHVFAGHNSTASASHQGARGISIHYNVMTPTPRRARPACWKHAYGGGSFR